MKHKHKTVVIGKREQLNYIDLLHIPDLILKLYVVRTKLYVVRTKLYVVRTKLNVVRTKFDIYVTIISLTEWYPVLQEK